jgi:DNA-directed RNA polymerase subunit K/omega
MYINQNDLSKISSTSKSKTIKTSSILEQLQTGGKTLNKKPSNTISSNTITSILQANKNKSDNVKLDKKKLFNKELSNISDTESEIKLSDSDESESDSDESDSGSEINLDEEKNEDEDDEVKSEFEKEENINDEDLGDVDDITSDISSSESDDDDDDKDDDKDVAVTEYNEDGEKEKDLDGDDKDDDDCLYQYDDLVDDRDTDKPPVHILNENRTTDPQMTHYEKIRLLGIRTKQIAMGAKVMVKYDGNMGAMELAKYELINKTTPLIIKRSLPNNTFELWKVSELNIDEDNTIQIVEELNQSFLDNQKLYEIV